MLALSPFRKHFLKKLKSSAVMDLAEACMYSEKKIETDPDVIKKLYDLQNHDRPVIVYAATLALINSSKQQIRDYALTSFLQSPQNAACLYGRRHHYCRGRGRACGQRLYV